MSTSILQKRKAIAVSIKELNWLLQNPRISEEHVTKVEKTLQDLVQQLQQVPMN